jgi:hypothetical protein
MSDLTRLSISPELEGVGHPLQSQSWISIDFSGFFSGSLGCLRNEAQ